MLYKKTEYGSTAGEVANHAPRGQPNRENTYFPVCPRSRLRIWSRETRSTIRSGVSLLILLRLNLVLRGLINAFYFSEKSVRFVGNFLGLTRTKTIVF